MTYPCPRLQPITNCFTVSDATVLLRDIAGDAAQQTAAKVNPSDDELNQIDEPAEDNTWHEKPDFQGMKQNVQNKLPSKQGAKEDAKTAAGDATQSAHPSGARDPQEAARLAADERQAGYQNTSVDAKSGGKAGVESMKQNLGGRFDEDQKQKMREYREKTNNYFKEKVPKDRRDQTIYRLKKMVVEIQTHRDCQYHSCICASFLHTTYADFLNRSTSHRHSSEPRRRVRRPHPERRPARQIVRERCDGTG